MKLKGKQRFAAVCRVKIFLHDFLTNGASQDTLVYYKSVPSFFLPQAHSCYTCTEQLTVNVQIFFFLKRHPGFSSGSKRSVGGGCGVAMGAVGTAESLHHHLGCVGIFKPISSNFHHGVEIMKFATKKIFSTYSAME